MKKYELLEKNENGLHRIRALRDFGNVKAGDIGGFVASEDNLSHDGDAWVYGDARVYGNALVYGNAQVLGDARVYGDVHVKENQHIKFGYYWNESLIDLLRCSLGVHPTKDGYVTLYKRVNENLSSEYDSSFIYPESGIVEVTDYDSDTTVSCGKGLHFSTGEYWPLSAGYRVLVAKVHLDDIICCQEGKIRVKRAEII